jgi:hypothetical protein
MQDSQGRLIPVDLVKDIDRARDDLVREIVSKAKEVSRQVATFKAGAMADIEAFVDLSGEKYGLQLGGKKGNITLTSYDGRYKIIRAVSEYIVFDERLQVAKQLIDECINEWSNGSRSEIRALVGHAFKTDAEGKVSTARIMGLKRLDIRDEKWQRAMSAIGDSMQVAGSKSYVRIYERVDNSEQYRQIPLDAAAL